VLAFHRGARDKRVAPGEEGAASLRSPGFGLKTLRKVGRSVVGILEDS